MSQEKVREILSHVDMTKIDLSSFQMSEKRVGESILYHVTMVIKLKKSNDEGTLLTLLQEFDDVTIHRIE